MKQIILCTILSLCPIAATAQTQEDNDKSYLTRLIEDNLSGGSREVNIIGFRGALSSAASLDVLTVADADGVWLTLEDVVLSWSRAALLRGHIDIQELSAERIIVARAPISEGRTPSPEATGFSLPELPVGIKLDQLDVAEITLGETFLGEKISLSLTGSAALTSGEGSAMIVATRLGPKIGRFSIDGSYRNESRILALDLTASEGPSGIASQLIGLPGQPSAELTISGTAPIDDYAATLSLATDGTDRISGAFALTSDDSGQLISLDVGGDVTPLFTPDYQDFFGDDVALTVQARTGSNGEIDLEDFTLSTKTLLLSGAAKIGAQGWPQQLNIRGQIADISGNVVLLPLPGPKTYIDSASFDLRFDTAMSSDWLTDLSLLGYDRPGLFMRDFKLSGGGILVPGEGDAIGAMTANLTYTASGLELDDAGESEAFGDTVSGVLQAARTEGTAIKIEQLTLTGPGVELLAKATIGGAASGMRTQSNILLYVDALERFPTLAGRDLTGSGNLAIESTILPLEGLFDIKINGKTLDLAIGIDQVDAVLAGHGDISATAVRDTKGTRLEELRVKTPVALLTANADLSSVGNEARFDAILTDVSLIEPRLSGPATMSGTVVQNADGILKVDISGDAKNSVFTLTADIDQDYLIDGTINADVTDLTTYSALIGQPISGGMSAQLTGSMLADLSAFDVKLGMQTSHLGVGNSIADILLAGNGQLAAQAQLKNGDLVITDMALSTANVTASGNLGGNSGAGHGVFTARLRDVGVLTEQLSGPITADGTASLDGIGNWGVEAQASGPGGIALRAGGQVGANGTVNLTATGEAPLGLANTLIEPRRISGDAIFDFAINGQPSLNALSGRLDLRNARLTAPTLAQGLSQIAGGVTFANGTAQIGLTGDVLSGGILAVRGPISLASPQAADLAIDLSEVILKDPELYQTSVSGGLTVKGPLAGGARIAGQLTLGQTDIQVPSSGVGALGDLPNVTHIGANAVIRTTLDRAGVLADGTNKTTSTNNAQHFPLDITISAPARIFIRGRGLDAELGGSLRIGGTTNNIQPIGLFELTRGRINILQQRFDLTEGSASLQGDFEPYIRLVATTEARTGTVISIIVEGPATEPEVSFVSTPSLPQDEVFAQLIFGRELQNISPLQAIQLVAAVGTLTGRGGGGLIDSFRQDIGLDDFDVTTDEDGKAAVRAGKYLSENIYTDVTVSSDGSTEINFNLDITDEVTAKGTVNAGGETGIGIFLERDY